MFNQVCLLPHKEDITPIPLIAAVGCNVISSPMKPPNPNHIGDIYSCNFKNDWKATHFDNYDKIFHTGTWSAPMILAQAPTGVTLLQS